MNDYRPFLQFMDLYDRAMAPLVTPEERAVLLKGALALMSTALQPAGVQELITRLVEEATRPPPPVEKPAEKPSGKARKGA